MQNQLLFLRIFKKCGWTFVQFVSSLASISAVFLFLLLIFLSLRPLPLNFLLPYVKPHLEVLSPPISVKNLSLVWRQWGHPFELQLDDLSLNISPEQKIEIPHLAIHLNFLKALQGKIIVSKATLLDATLPLDLKGGGGKFFDIAKIFDPSFLEGLETLTLKEPSFEGLFDSKSFTWPGLSLKMKRKVNFLRVEAAVKSTPFLTMTLRLNPVESTLAVSATLDALTFPAEISLFPFLTKLPPLSGSFEGIYDLKKNTWLEGQGSFAQKNKDPIAFRVEDDSFTLEGLKGNITLQGDRVRFDSLDFKINDVAVKLQGNFDGKSQKYGIKAAILNAVPRSLLFRIWPKTMAVDAREWVFKNILTGSAQNITTATNGIWSLDTGVKVGGFITQMKLDGLTIAYLEGMPVVKNVAGDATLDRQKFFIAFTKGAVEQQTVQKGTLLIGDLDQEDQYLKLDVQVQGPLKNILSIIDNPPLEYTRQLEFKANSCTGDASTRLKLDFPVKKDLTFKDIKVQVGSDLKNVSLSTFFEKTKTPLSLKKGSLRLNATERKLSLKGKGEVNGRTANVFWGEKFGPQGNRLYGLEMPMTPADLLSWKIDLREWISGNFTLSLSYNTPSGKKSSSFLELKANFEKAALDFPFLSWGKKPGASALFSTSIEFEPQGKILLKNVHFKAPHMSAAGRMIFSQDHSLELLDIPLLTAPETEASLFLTRDLQKGYLVTLKGKSFNFSNFLAGGDVKMQRFLDPQTPINLFLSLEKGFAGKGGGVALLTGTLKGHQVTNEIALDQANLSGVAGTWMTSNSNKRLPQPGEFSVSFQHKTLLAQANDAGAFLKLLGLHDEIKGGSLALKAHQSDPLKPYEGEIKIKDFEIKNMPILTRLLALSSPAGIIDFISSENLGFSRFHVHFSALNDQIILREAKAIGPGLGIIFNGTVDPQKKSLFLVGNVIPAYAINSILSAIPLIGDLFFGGKDSGFLATRFTLKGPISNPHIDVNPFYFLAPGILKNLFEDSEEEEKSMRDAEKAMGIPTKHN